MGHECPLPRHPHTLALPQERHPTEGHPTAQHRGGSTQHPPGQWGWTQGHGQSMSCSTLSSPPPKPGFSVFFPIKKKKSQFYIFLNFKLLSSRPSAHRARALAPRPSTWARLSSQAVLAAADAPRSAGHRHVPGTCGQGSLGTSPSPSESSPYHPLRGAGARQW